jgi:uncharacterized protein (TIGR03437 family)
VAYDHGQGAARGVTVRDLQTEKESFLQGAFQPRWSSDGSTLITLRQVGAAVQTFVLSADGSERQLTWEPGGIADAAISGDGQTAFSVGVGGMLIRTYPSTGESAVLLPAFATTYPSLTLSPGSAARLPLYGLTGVRVWLDAQEAPVTAVGPEEVEFQAPWELTGQETTIRVDSEGAMLESQPQTMPVRQIAAAFASAPIHEGFQALVTADMPAEAGEVLHLYMTGLGPVDPPLRTGEAGAAAPLSKARAELRCKVGEASAAVLFAGLAPGLVGFYQADIRVPEEVKAGAELMICTAGDSQTAVEVNFR